VTICGGHGMALVEDLISAGALLTPFFAWNVAKSVQSSWK